MVDLPKIGIATPALADSNNGNWHTAARWARHLGELADVCIFDHWNGQPLRVLIALHARKSAASIDAFRRGVPGGRVVLVMTGTDLYRDLPTDPLAIRSLEQADAIVVLQDKALHALPAAAARKARVIVQSSDVPLRAASLPGVGLPTRFIAIGHVRDVKDPATLARAAVRLRHEAGIEIEHLGAFLDPGLADELRQLTKDCGRYRLLGGLSHPEALDHLMGVDALVHPSKMEGGANVVIEAVCAGVPVIASAIDGNTGLLGEDYGGYFPVGDDMQLARLMQRFASDDAFAMQLRRHCETLRARFAPEREAALLRSLVEPLL